MVALLTHVPPLAGPGMLRLLDLATRTASLPRASASEEVGAGMHPC